MRRSMAALCLLVIFPFAASALGLGDIALDSALNQPFSAEIPLDSYEEADLNSLSVDLASEATFERYGLDQPAFLLDFEFRVKSNTSGEPVVSITSLPPVSEPFVTLLLDVKWASGRLLREYTVLLDPPLFESQPVQTSVAAPVTAAPADTASESSNQGVASGQVSRAPEPASTPVSEPAPTPRQTQPVPVQTSGKPDTAAAPVGISSEYSVQRRDTLWGIAKRVKGESDLTTNQVMLALYRANPEAFLGNINRLKAGAILRVPQQAELSGLTPGEATAAVREQNAAVSQPTISASEPARLTLVAPAEDSTEDSAAGISEATASADPATATASVDGALDAVAQDVATDQMRGRIGELESELTESRRLVNAQDAEMAALQRRIQVLEARNEGESAADELAADDAVAVDDADSASATEAVDEAPLFADQGEAADLSSETVIDAVEETADLSPEAIADPVTSVPAREESPSFISGLLGNLWFWISAAVVLVLALFVVRRRNQDDETDLIAEQDVKYAKTIGGLEPLPEAEGAIVVEETAETSVLDEELASEGAQRIESLLDDAESQSEPEPEYDATAELPAAEEGDAETPLEKTTSIGAPLNLDKADPIAEADFHMAYGLYDQAAELLEQALESEPDKRDYRVKLVEVFFVWENREGFLKHASLLNDDIGDASDADWNKVVILGKQLCPDEEMFSGAETSAPAADSMDFEISDTGEAELDFTIGGSDSQVEALSEDIFGDGDSAADGALDFDLSDGAFESGTDDDLTVDLSSETIADEDSAATMETPTIEVDAIDGGDTVETPTLESPALSHDDAVTLEAPVISGDAETSELTELNPEAFDTQSIDLDLGGSDDLDVDLSGLDVDLSGLDDSTEVTIVADATDEGDNEDIDATLLADAQSEDQEETLLVETGTEEDEEALFADSVDLEAEIEAELDAQAGDSDTVEQPQLDTMDTEAEETAEQPTLVSGGAVDFDLGMEAEDEDDLATAIEQSSLSEDATMTEVGTKLDLARAYIDMGDPDGARSILNEVLDEGSDEQQQEARQLLEELSD